MTKKIVILGGGGAGLFTGATIKAIQPNMEVVMISDEDLFCRCSSPYVITQQAEFKETVMPDSMTTSMGIDLKRGKAISVNKEKKEVTFLVKGNKEKITYDILVFATGARAFIPPFEGHDLEGVYPMRRVEDLEHILEKKKKSKSVTVVGGGVIGIEMASALRETGLTVNLVSISKKILFPLADNLFEELILEKLKSSGIKCFTNSMVTKIENKGTSKKISFKSDEKISSFNSDFVILATGIRANLDIAQDMGVEVSKFGILVNDYFETNKKGIYAVGDVAVSRNMILENEKSTSQLASNAVIQGKIAGKNIAGISIPYAGHTSAMGFQFLGKEFGSCGLSERSCQEKNIDYIKSIVETTNIYEDLNKKELVKMKMLFEKKSLKILGIQVFGKDITGYINVISLAIQNKNTAFDMQNWNYVAHPVFSPWPFKNPIVMACEEAMQN